MGTNAAHEPLGFLDKHKTVRWFDAELGRHLALGLGPPASGFLRIWCFLFVSRPGFRKDSMFIADLTVTESAATR